jgi:hypothetical protein
MQIIKNTFILVFIYFMTFVLVREAMETHLGITKKGYGIPHKMYSHSIAPNIYQETSNKMPENYLIKTRSNSQGLREDKDFKIPKPEGFYRILLVGDSFVLERALNYQ